MTPDEIKQFLTNHYPALSTEQRFNPNGWSFFLGAKRGGIDSNRIVRATRSSPEAPTKLKLAVTSRLTEELELEFRGGSDELQRLVDWEIRLWHKHFADRPSESES